jgi:HD-like signal output (HDOD) protein/CheY-like chemotaxis protein
MPQATLEETMNDSGLEHLIYVVDDEPAVLQALKLTLRRFGANWRVQEFAQPEAALAAVKVQAPDLLLTDQFMPGLCGSQLLDLVRQIAPQTVRIIMSGQLAKVEKISAAHQYLGKPFNNKELRQRLCNALGARQLLEDPALRNLMGSLNSFPVLPHHQVELLRELDAGNTHLQQAASIVSEDGGVMTKLLQIANSPLFQNAGPVSEPRDLLLQLGTRTTKAAILSLHIFEKYSGLESAEVSAAEIWQHSWRTAEIARDLCRANHMGEDALHNAFFAGLIHNLGRLILLENHSPRYLEICHQARSEAKPLHLVEKEVFGVHHTDLTAFMLRLWGTTPPVVDAIRHYHEPWKQNSPGQKTVADVLHAANILSHQHDSTRKSMCPELNRDYFGSIGMDLAAYHN